MLPLLLTLATAPTFAEGPQPAETVQVDAASTLVVDAPVMEDGEVPVDDPATGQDNLNKAIIITMFIAMGALLATAGTLICCCCFYYNGYY